MTEWVCPRCGGDHSWCQEVRDDEYGPGPSERFKRLLEQSSLGTPEAKHLRASVSPEKAAELVRRAEELSDAQF